MRSGFVSLIGRPNTGKSTLINALVGYKIAITSNKAQTTRNNIQGIYNDEDAQIVFVDTPGIHKPKDKLGQRLNDDAYFSIDDVDIILFLIDVTMPFGKGDNFVLDRIKEANKPVFLILNKVDKINNEKLIELINKYKDLYDFKEIIPISALKEKNLKELIKTLKEYLPDKVKYFPDSDLTNTTKEFRVSELIREKVLRLTHDEVPHAITCVVEKFDEKKDKAIINATIIVERDSLKSIIIGKKGSMLKEIGTKARHDIEDMLGKKVYLELFVKTIKNWRDKEKYLKELGFYDIDEE
ncbi:MAG TPA: GTPase Era [Candidatus Aphodocola excrementigallinarum]|uniref:GTPase Era n=1 Tax=Candidatus Aphodocola excrementigallinarum TaxID=2840670 RepID=A0A9D1INW0_9FIRM|nr:GTPase Era [Candidatus Aphodocola excrementigallinarum]